MKNPFGIRAFGTHLRQLREAQNLSQQELADLADIAKITVQRIENAKFSPTLDVLIALSHALGTSLPQLVDFTVPREKKG